MIIGEKYLDEEWKEEEMIFISYNHGDQDVVDMIAKRLEIEFGRDNIFYDKWSMQPGDSIIGKMDEGLEKVTTFFYFLSSNSLNSNMVKKEWQAALTKSLYEGVKFVPIKVSDCKIPAILTDVYYIDLFSQGLDNTIEQMRSVISGSSRYTPLPDIENLQVSIKYISTNEVEFKIFTTHFVESDASFGFVCKNPIDSYEVRPLTETIYRSMQGETYKKLSDGREKAFKMQIGILQRSITPSQPFIGRLVSKQLPLQLEGILHIKSFEPVNFRELKINIEQ
ncbi:TPA: toll/interleukin-1 receptor domain-containing protein [Streptococcus suis]|uniref:toll/interleukin-1 receptor domain-containing protein n=1 Tax=Streptococcus suis TaxID=1307 RepID=UPI0024123292|nr:toll/interleukin-1 receptor domain-containing protein [Streptococcus suis]